MASESKKKKGVNAFVVHLGLKSKRKVKGNKFKGIKGLDFYTSSDRHAFKNDDALNDD